MGTWPAVIAIDTTRRILLTSLAGAAVAAPFSAGRRVSMEEPITLRYTAHVPRSHGLYTRAFVPFAAMVEQETQGRLRLQGFADRLLHGPLDGFKAAVTGITDYTHTSPYNIISRTPVRRLEDLRGMKIRVTAGLTADIYRELGAVPVSIAAAEIYPAFQRGVLDAVTLSLSDIVAYRLQEIGRFHTRCDINVVVLHYCLNRRTFDALPDDLREKFYRLLRMRSQIAVQHYYSGGPTHERAVQTLLASGVEVRRLCRATGAGTGRR